MQNYIKINIKECNGLETHNGKILWVDHYVFQECWGKKMKPLKSSYSQEFYISSRSAEHCS